MSEASIYLTQIKELSETLEQVIAEVPPAQFNERPGPHLNPVGWNCFHLLRVWEVDVNMICRGQSLHGDAWHRGGFTEKSGYDPVGKGALGLGDGYGYSDDDVDEIQIDPAVLSEYQQLLWEETSAYLSDASDDEMHRQAPTVLDPYRTKSVAEQLRHVIAHSYEHVGEMRYAMGMLGWSDPSYPGSSD